MRLINTSTFAIQDFTGKEVPQYAILSHRWHSCEEEVSYHDFLDGAKRDTYGWRKVQSCCQTALINDLHWCWIDTCCINKASSSEESRSINSMFAWYEGSAEGFVYLDDVDCLDRSTPEAQSEIAASRWFTRGWTLQELIAPSKLTFFNSRWESLGTRSDLVDILTKITSIPADVLTGQTSHLTCSIAQRMFWAADRTTTVVEDQSYSLMGLFDVNMPLIYGEGTKAFMRLQEEIIQRSTDQTIFAWTDSSPQKGVLAPDPSCFKTHYGGCIRSVPTYFSDDPASDNFSLGNAGLLVQFVLIPWATNTYLAPLRCYVSSRDPNSNSDPSQRVCLILRRTTLDNRFVRISHTHNNNTIDLLLHRYLRVPSDPNPSYWNRSRLHRTITISRSPKTTKAITDCHYGFHFVFQCPSLFSSGSKPDPKDVVCADEHTWDRNNPQLKITQGTFRVAGIFRLNPKRCDSSFLVMGFDCDFNPFILIFSPPLELMKQFLPLLNVKREIIDPKDLSTMSSWERSSWLDAMYLHKYLEEVIRLAKESPFDWQGHAVDMGLLLGNRGTAEEVFEVPKWNLMVIFKLVDEKGASANYWRITFKDFPALGRVGRLPGS